MGVEKKTTIFTVMLGSCSSLDRDHSWDKDIRKYQFTLRDYTRTLITIGYINTAQQGGHLYIWLRMYVRSGQMRSVTCYRYHVNPY